MLALNLADWLIIIIVVISTLMSIRRGFVKEALSLVNLLFAVFIAWAFAPLLADRLTGTIESATLRYVSSLGILFIASLMLGAALNFVLASLLKAGGLSGTDRLLGTLFGALRGLVIVMTLLVFAPKALPVDQEAWWVNSAFIPKLAAFEDSFTESRVAVQSWIEGLFTKENQQRLQESLPEQMRLPYESSHEPAEPTS